VEGVKRRRVRGMRTVRKKFFITVSSIYLKAD